MTFPEMIHGKKPEVAPFIPTDPIEMLRQLMTGEIKDWPQIEQLSNLYQTYMMGALDKAVPGFGEIMKTGGEDTQAILDAAKPLIEGKIPEDVMAQVFRSSAFGNLKSGLLGSPAGSANQARQLGLTSLDLMKQGTDMATAGTNAAQRWQDIAKATILPPSSSLYSPQWFTQFMAEQNAARQATKQLKFNVAARPDPVVSGIAGTIMNLVGAYLGHGAGGGGNMIPSTTEGVDYNTFQSQSANQAGMSVPQWQGQVSNSLYSTPATPPPTQQFLTPSDGKTVIPASGNVTTPGGSAFNFDPNWQY